MINKKRKIAFVDNMNHNLFVMARYFHDIGFDCSLYIIPNAPKQFDPSTDTLNKVKWIKYFPCDYSPKSFIVTPTKKIFTEFKSYNFIVACGFSVGLLNKSNINIDLFLPYGADIFNYPFKPNYRNIFHYIPRLFLSFFRSKMQFDGIKKSKIVFCSDLDLRSKNALKLIGKKNTYCLSSRVYLNELDKILKISSNQWDYLKQHDIIIFSPSRHLWKTNSDPMPDFKSHGGMKGNDLLINAFAKIVKNKVYKSPILILIDYGTDVPHSKKLILDLKIQKNVKWIPIMKRKEILILMSKCSFVADQFREGLFSASSGITQESLAVGTPIITNASNAHVIKNDPHYGAPYLQAKSTLEILKFLNDYKDNKMKYIKMGNIGKKWFQDNLAIGLAKKQSQIITMDKRKN